MSAEVKTRMNIFKQILLLTLSVSLFWGSQAAAEDDDYQVLVMGDSLSAGYNLPSHASFPAQLETWLGTQGLSGTVINAGVSGDTSTGGRARLDWVLENLVVDDLDLVIVEFGGNDVLRGTDPSVTRANLDAMIETLTARNIPVLLAGMRSPPSMGSEYEAEFNGLYPDIAEKYDIPFYPFFLDGVATIPDLLLGDGIHPNEAGVGIMVSNMGVMILELLTAF